MAERILIVDDERAICIAIQRLLSGRGYDVETAASAEQAIGAPRAEPLPPGDHRPEPEEGDAAWTCSAGRSSTPRTRPSS